jgi:RNA polymerase sigma factor (sigma-70 family)
MTSVSTDASRDETVRADRAARLGACLDRARNGQAGAFDEAVRELNPLLWHVARAQGLGSEEAADVVQTTWLALLRQLHEIRTPQALTGWLVTTARREAWRVRDRSRRQHPTETPLAALVAAEPPPDEQVVLDERDRILWEHFQTLTPRCQTLLRVVAQVHRPDYAAVAEAMGMPRGSIGPTRGRCLAKLRELLLADPVWLAS